MAYLKHPMASALLIEPRGYCIFLPGAHYLTINSRDGADSSLNKLLLLYSMFYNTFSLYSMFYNTSVYIQWSVIRQFIFNVL